MSKIVVLTHKNDAPTLPITLTIATYLLLDHFKVSSLIWGIYITFAVIVWIAAIFDYIVRVSGKVAEIMEDGSIKIK